MSSADEIDREVRELVRRRGVDPMGDPAAVGGLIDEVLAAQADRVAAGAAEALADPRDVRRVVLDAVAGFGPLQRFLDDPTVEEIWVNGPGRVFVARSGRSELTTTILAPGQVEELVLRALERTGRRVDLSTPFVDAMLPDGSRLHVVIPDVTREHWAVNIRKFVARAHSLSELVPLGTLTPHSARFLEASVVAGLNVIVSGGTQSGKTTLLNCLAGAIPTTERVISCEEVFELQLRHHPDWVPLQTRQPNLEGTGEIPLRRLVTEALRMRPDRLIVGEVRQAEALDLLIALNAGLPGLCSVHANSARQAVTKLCTLPLLAGTNVHPSFVVPTVATCVDLVVHLELTAAGHRRVREVVAVGGHGSVETAAIFATSGGELVRADGFPPHGDRYSRVGVDLPALMAV
ncbi:CpaF family protein [Cryptosporangium aurantiacum]|uniref:Pilus assembly protein CpaF n=1 Tax=Cryptosporangium aurantiacum TaxID=134849 RepID=A0A1M7RNK6_9ACTN|nr:ATPase, T2SS/T4P/T4SS family [Cryptosporangium aurantiacum]SHN47799.1 pilus assembly protein CpaF [Cryptosporangium aurantiacum]